MRDLDQISGIAIFGLGIAILLGVLYYYPIGSSHAPGAGFFPLIISFSIIGLSITLVIQSTLGGKKKASQNLVFLLNKKSFRRILLGFIFLVGFRYVLPRLGFAPTTFLYLTFNTYFLGQYNWKVCLLFSLMTTVLAYLVFQFWLEIPMPPGVLGM